MESKKEKILALVGVILVTLMVVTVVIINYFISNTLSNLNFDVVANKIEDNEILTDTNFIIKSEKDYSKQLMKKIVAIEPDIDYTITKMAKGTYSVIPSQKLEDDSIYNLYIDARKNAPKLSWAFQTKTDFKVTNTTPLATITHVAKNTGIEITFSKPVNDIKDYFEIYPKVDGDLTYSDKKAIFIPNELLKDDTVYKVTLKKELKDSSGEELGEEYTFSFRTKPDKSYIRLVSEYQETFNTTKEPNIKLSMDRDVYNDITFSVKVYKLSSLKEYMTYLETHYKNIDSNVGESYDHNFDMSKYTPVYSFESKAQKDDWYNRIDFPEKLDIGWYIADISNLENGIHLQTALQITDLSVYMYGLNNDVRVWINDVQTDLPVSGATVQIGELASISNKNGIAEFNVSYNDPQKIIITTKSGKEFGEYRKVTNFEEISLKDDYYMYLYTDRSDYLPTDTINYWGVILPRKSGISKPEEVQVKINSDISQKAKVDENGAFSGSINLLNHSSVWGEVYLSVDSRKSYMKDIQISEDIEPVYKLSSAFNKPYYRQGDKISLNVYGKFYDGTSAKNVKVRVKQGDSDYETVTLDLNGEANVTLTPNTNDPSGDFSYLQATLEIAGIDEDAMAYNSVPYFPTDYYIDTIWKSSDKKLVLTTQKVNYSAIDESGIDYEKIYTGESFAQNVSADLIEITTEKRYTGKSNYNYYTSTYEPEYVWDRIENVIETYNWVINKGEKLEVNIPKVTEKDNVRYQLKINYTYPDGFSGYKTMYLYSGDYTNNAEYYAFETDNYELKENESTRLTLQESGNKTGKMLYVVSTDRINTIGVTDNNYMDLKMTKDLIPNCIVAGAFFDGENVHKINESYIYFNTKDKELSVDIKTDKESYKPGDKVKAVARVTDSEGEPVQCNFLFSVVDEAALFNNFERDPLSKIYEMRYHYPRTFASDKSEDFGGGEGGGGNDEIRDTFTDVLTFTPLYTDSNGEAEVTFDVSDDLTSWRITGIAVSNDAKAGKTKKNITTTIPFFINPVINTKYTSKDDITISLRVAGTDAALLSSSVKYDIELLNQKDEVVKSESAELNPQDVAMISLGKHEIGKYKIKVTATSGDKKDSIIKETEIVNSLHEIYLTKEMPIEEIKNIQSVRYPLHLMIFDKDDGIYYKSLMKILEKSNGGTNEQIIGRNYAHSKLNEIYKKDVYNVETNLALHGYGGGISRLANENIDTLFTAQAVISGTKYINKTAQKEHFEEVLNNDESLPNNVTAAYMGLAALKEPVLNDVKFLLENSNGLELLDKINLIDALAYIGDNNSAKAYYEKEIKPLMVETDSEKYVSSDYETYYYQATSRILPALALIGHEDFEKVLQYVLKNDTKEYLPIMDLMIYLNNYNPNSNTDSKLVYSVMDKKEKVDFIKDRIKILDLSKAEYESLKIEKVKGDIEVIAEYIGDVQDVKTSSDIKVTKTISKGNLGEYSDVTLNLNFNGGKEGCYVVDDVIPASSRYVSSKTYDFRWSLFDHEAQKVRFYVYPRGETNITVQYKIRNVFLGEFAVEPAYMTNEAGEIVGFSEDSSLTFNVK